VNGPAIAQLARIGPAVVMTLRIVAEGWTSVWEERAPQFESIVTETVRRGE